VVLDGDLQPRVLHLASDLAQEAHDGLDVRLDGPGRCTDGYRAHEADGFVWVWLAVLFGI
jgi:hypothetical protein